MNIYKIILIDRIIYIIAFCAAKINLIKLKNSYKIKKLTKRKTRKRLHIYKLYHTFFMAVFTMQESKHSQTNKNNKVHKKKEVFF